MSTSEQDPSASSLAERFAGRWHLVSLVTTTADGEEVESLGSDPRGSIFYDQSGFMGVHLMRSDRPRFSESPAEASHAELLAAFSAFTGYCGTWTLHPEEGKVVHHVELTSSPAMDIGDELSRWYEFEGNCLTLRTAPPGSSEPHGVIVWERR
jgi:hypothetical protein